MNGRRTVLGSIDMHAAVAEIDRIPAQCHEFDGTQAMAIGNEHHSRIAVAIAIIASDRDQPLDLGLGKVFA